ncbi:unnamed protein product [Acanthoscelides obtectus]|uniref:Uncharacterized protein n=1 Tax=Acanthoscelides obtectus TaxID=200917 RepID=A0A9P0MK49_ACAOB|nr:unnamed protein product [Acanthoscelides obtectus]CAK1670994.1 hypothetical protein AOBTE_LOCUS27963 [Acanthoscelides obtectus]
MNLLVIYGDSDYEEALLKWVAEVDEENENDSDIDSDAEFIYADHECVWNKVEIQMVKDFLLKKMRHRTALLQETISMEKKPFQMVCVDCAK